MELTKADKKRINDETDKIIMRINIEATEYAELYEQTYLKTLADKINCKIEASAYVVDRSLEMANKRD